MNRRALVLTFILALSVSSVVGVQTVKAQFTPDGKYCPLVGPIEITSPSNSTYSSNLLTLNITVQSLFDTSEYRYNMVYSVDGENNVTIPQTSLSFDYPPSGPLTPVTVTGWVTLPELSEGTHSLTVYANYERTGVNTNYPALILDNSTVYFTISQQIEASHSPSPQQSSNPQQVGGTRLPMEYVIGIIVASIIILITISIGILVYLKRKH